MRTLLVKTDCNEIVNGWNDVLMFINIANEISSL